MEDALKLQTGMNLGQLLSIPFIIAGIILILYSRGLFFGKKKKIEIKDA